MRFGIFSVVDHYPDELSRSSAQFYEELLEQVEWADRLGFDSFWVAEHHFHEYGAIPRPAVWMAAAAQRTKKIKLGAAVLVLSFDNPLRAAEDYAMVDSISGGRLILGVGSGYLQHEFEGFGIPVEEKRDRFDESLAVMLEAWKGERFSFNGKYHQIKDVKLNITPVQQPHPEVCIAILSNQAGKFVGKRGFPIMMIPYATTESFDELSTTVSEYRSGFAESGRPASEAIVPFGLHTFCAETPEDAEKYARPAMDRYVRTRLYAKQRSYDTLVEKDLVAFGTPEDVARVAKKYEAAGLTDFLAIMNFGGMPHEQVMKSMQLLSKAITS